VVFPSSDKPAEVVHPGEQPFHFPAPFVAAQFAPVLGLAPAAAVGRDHLDAAFIGELLIERVRTVGFVADQPRREFVEEASDKNLFHKLALGSRSALDGANGEAPFLALAKVASTNASSRFSLPCAWRCAASSFRACSSLPLRIQFWKRRRQVWNGGYFSAARATVLPFPEPTAHR
jgi:hypothetical protein